MGSNPNTSGVVLKPQLEISVMNGKQTYKNGRASLEPGSSAGDGIRKMTPALGLMNEEHGALGTYTKGIDGQVLEGKPTEDNKRNPNHRAVFRDGPEDYRSKDEKLVGKGLEWVAQRDGKNYILRARLPDGQIVNITPENLILDSGEKLHLLLILNSGAGEVSKGEKALLFEQFQINDQNAQIVDSSLRVRIQDLVFDVEIAPELFESFPVTYSPARIGNEIRPIRWEAWVQPRLVKAREWMETQQMDELRAQSDYMDGLSPLLMALAQELGSKRRADGPHFPFTRQDAGGAGGVQARSDSEIDDGRPPQEGWVEEFGRKTPKRQAGRVQDAQVWADGTGAVAHEMNQTVRALALNAIGAWNELSNAQKGKNDAKAQKTAGGMKTGSAAQTDAVFAKSSKHEMTQAQTFSQPVPLRKLAGPLTDGMAMNEAAVQTMPFSQMTIQPLAEQIADGPLMTGEGTHMMASAEGSMAGAMEEEKLAGRPIGGENSHGFEMKEAGWEAAGDGKEKAPVVQLRALKKEKKAAEVMLADAQKLLVRGHGGSAGQKDAKQKTASVVAIGASGLAMKKPAKPDDGKKSAKIVKAAKAGQPMEIKAAAGDKERRAAA